MHSTRTHFSSPDRAHPAAALQSDGLLLALNSAQPLVDAEISGLGLNFSTEIDGPDGWFELVPAGKIVGRDGRSWLNEDPEAIAAALVQPVPVDVNHSSVLKLGTGEPSPAVAWVEEARVTDTGGVEYRLAWNAEGRELVEGKKYRFLSPVFTFDKQGRVTGLHSVGLLNGPNLLNMAINSETLPGTGTQDSEVTAMNEELLKLLGLNADATDVEVLASVRGLIEGANAAKPDVPMVPKSHLESEIQKREQLEQSLNSMKLEQDKAALDELLDSAVADKKITPATRDHYEALAVQRDDQGTLVAINSAQVESMRQLFDSSAPLAGSVDLPQGSEDSVALNAMELEIAKNMGLTPEEMYGDRKGDAA